MKGCWKTSKSAGNQSGSCSILATLEVEGELTGRNWKLSGYFLVKRLYKNMNKSITFINVPRSLHLMDAHLMYPHDTLGIHSL